MMNSHQLLLLKISSLAICVALVAGCEPKNEARWKHEPARAAFTPTETPDRAEVKAAEFTAMDVDALFAKTNDGNNDLTASVLKPVGAIVLNRRFIEDPKYRGARLAKMINLFNAAFVKEYKKQPQAPDFAKIRQDYYNTVFAGCNADLKTGCVNAALFAADGRHTLIMTLFAREQDAQLDILLKTMSPAECVDTSESCRVAIDERYRRLAMGLYKSSRYQDNDFAFAYLKYARVFSAYLNLAARTPVKKGDPRTLGTSYLAEVHGKIFESVISKFKPTNPEDAEYRAFVENFNPWGFSRKRSDSFQYGTGVMFALGAQCCLYADKEKTQVSDSVRKAIDDSQKDKDTMGGSFRQMVEEIKKDHKDRVFKKLGLSKIVSLIENPKSSFYDEYFYIVDRLFRGHLGTGDIEMMLRNTNAQRARTQLPSRISDYIKVNLVYMVMETNRFMAEIYKSDIASDRIFEEAIKRSRDLTARWYEIQAQIDLLDKLMNSYFKERLITSTEYTDTFNLIRAVNRNIHYLAVFPNMIVMNYYLTKMKGVINVHTWWGEKFQINADTILKSFFDVDGYTATSWFRFGKDPEIIDRLNLLYSLEFLLSTEALNSFVAKDSTSDAESERNKFFDLVFTRYFNDGIDTLRNEILDYKRKTEGHPFYGQLIEMCDYETKGGTPPHVVINFLDLGRFTYSGLGDNSINSVMRKFLSDAKGPATDLITQIERRRTFLLAMMEVIEGDLIRTDQTQRGAPHADLRIARAMLKDLDSLQGDLTKLFVANHKNLFECATRLREIERRRANRLYDAEREFLGEIFNKIKPIAALTDSKEQEAKIQELNNTYFTEANGFKFDRLDGLTFRMSKFDLFMRMKKRIESDIFMQPTPREIKFYGEQNLKSYLRRRVVRFEIPDGISREEMYARGQSRSISFLGSEDKDREEFIRQGMSTLNAKTGAYVEWKGQMEGDRSQFDYLNTLIAFYLLPKSESAAGLEVTAKDLVDVYIKLLAGLGMDPYDQDHARLFQWEAHYSKKFLQSLLFDKDGMNRYYFFWSLMNDVAKAASIDFDAKGTVLAESLDLAKRINSMQAFVFQPSNTVRDTVQSLYGNRGHFRLNKVVELYEELNKRAREVKDAAELDPRLTLPLYFEGDSPRWWYSEGIKALVDPQKLQDLRFLITDFTQKTGKFYSTQEKVKAP